MIDRIYTLTTIWPCWNVMWIIFELLITMKWSNSETIKTTGSFEGSVTICFALSSSRKKLIKLSGSEYITDCLQLLLNLLQKKKMDDRTLLTRSRSAMICAPTSVNRLPTEKWVITYNQTTFLIKNTFVFYDQCLRLLIHCNHHSYWLFTRTNRLAIVFRPRSSNSRSQSDDFSSRRYAREFSSLLFNAAASYCAPWSLIWSSCKQSSLTLTRLSIWRMDTRQQAENENDYLIHFQWFCQLLCSIITDLILTKVELLQCLQKIEPSHLNTRKERTR